MKYDVAPPPAARLRPLVYAVPGNHGETYKIEAKGPGFRKVLGTLPTRALAFAAFNRWVSTGELPQAAKRGPKGPQKAKRKPPAPREKKPIPPLPIDSTNEERIAHLKQLWRRHQ